MGQDIAEYGGVFKITEGFVEKFGKERVRNTPICESSIIEIAMGLSICNRKKYCRTSIFRFYNIWVQPSGKLFSKNTLQMGSKC